MTLSTRLTRLAMRRAAPDMSVTLKLTLFGLALVAVFVIAYVVGGALIPEAFVEGWIEGNHDH